MRQIAGLCLLALGLISTSTIACTDFKLVAKDNSVLVTRTMEFSTNLKSNVRTSPRARQFNEISSDKKPALSWKAKYGYVFLDGLDVDATLDGMNEAGLSFEYLYLPGETQYPTVPKDKDARALPYLHLGDWALSQFKTVDEVKAALKDVYVFAEPLAGTSNMIFPLHAALYDANGKGIVIEFVNGAMQVYDNEVGTLTNSPTFGWQVVNLRNYVNLSPWTPNPVVVNGMVFAGTGQGSGMKGLPGDISPPSRFAKISILKAAAYPASNMTQMLNTAQHIINNVDIPLGVVRAKVENKVSNEYTQWTVFKDLTNKVFYYRTFVDTTLHAVMLSQLNFAANSPRLKMSIADDQYIMDMTSKLVGSHAAAPPTMSASITRVMA